MQDARWRAPELRMAGGLTALVVAVRLWMAHALTYCGTPDACFYLGMAQTLGAGHGFHARFLYDFQQGHPTLPNTGLEYWRPGISLLLAALKPLGATTLHGSIAITTLAGVLFAAAAWHIAMQTSRDRRLALRSFALCLVGPTFWIGSMSPDSGLYYGAAVAWFLALFTVRRQGLWQDVGALGCVCAAYGVRNDAALLLLPLLAVLWQRRRLSGAVGGSPLYAAGMLAGFALALLPMHLLFHAVLGTTFPSGTAQTLFFYDLSDFTRYRDPVSRHTLLSHGVKHLLLVRASTLITALYRIAAFTVGYAALVFLPTLFFRQSDPQTGRKEASHGAEPLPELTGAAVFFLTALAAYTLVLPAVGGFAVLRTASALSPLVSVLVIVAIGRVARTPAFALALTTAVIGVNALSGILDDRRDALSMESSGSSDRATAAQLHRLGADPGTAVILTGDPVQFSVTTGYAAVALPGNGLAAIAAAARDFHATDVLLNTEDLPGTFAALNDQLHPVRSAFLPAEHTLILALPPHADGE